MRRLLVVGSLILCVLFPSTTKAQDPFLELVKGATKKVIKAVDLMVQRLQNKTIWLQKAQKTIENTLNKLKLDEISAWVEKHKEQYAVYYKELRTVKEIISGYYEVKSLIKKQILLVDEYKQALRLFKGDNHFSVEEIDYMERVYSGIIRESIDNLDRVITLISSNYLQMTDGERLREIHPIAEAVDKNLQDLRAFTQSNQMASLQRAKDLGEVDRIRSYYGLQ